MTHTINAYQGRDTYMQGGSPTIGGARARRDQTLQICRSVPTYAFVVCVINPQSSMHHCLLTPICFCLH